MIRDGRNWLLLATLAGLLAAAPAAFAGGPYESNPGFRVDIHRDRLQQFQTRRQIHREHMRLRFDRRQFGPYSRQARVERYRLRHAQYRFYHHSRDLHRDRVQLRHRRFRRF
ncbi:MAG TPA: hypothetical protein VMW54_10640 [Terriglobia bacterium]|nr:hypothetical protein [Terriglobia bacterium]